MTNQHRDLARIVDKLRAPQWSSTEVSYTQQDAHHCKTLAEMNQGRLPSLLKYLIPAAVLGGVILAAALIHADPIGRTADVVANPHIEGF